MLSQAVHSVGWLVGLSVFANNFYNARLQRFSFTLLSVFLIAYTFICFAYLRKIFFCLLCFKEMGEGRVTLILEGLFVSLFCDWFSFSIHCTVALLSSLSLLV